MLVKEKKSMRDDEKKKILGQLDYKVKTTAEIWAKDSDFKEMRKNFSVEFQKLFMAGYTQYYNGNFQHAEELFSQCLKIKPKDGPTLTLKHYIDDLNCRAPFGWKGYRELTSK